MFSQSICKICKHFVSCKDYRTRKCFIQTKLFSEIIRSSAKNDDIINYCNKEFSGEATLAWYAQAHIMKENGASVKEISKLCTKSKSATYTALTKADNLCRYDKTFLCRILAIIQKLNKP